ncbi:hypothetical protein [Catenuloplanes atrovinosus]|uniref:Uncharacterized protein n=1 Tax=Catenuloplanes atrovinosus TaxID=137266 RepID=A0AAE4CDJ4_9ACTN|nr:hypothetical protein [Catenuloplanes atrovinosus]MDR7279119.1 hypothetical protein [Catenuloplanes atrovinosus]
MSDHDLARLRAELDRLTGPARAQTLHDLTRAHTNRFWRAGPGRADARPDLDAAIAAATETYGWFRPGDALRPQIASQLGWLLATRHLAYGTPAEDRETGIARLVEALESPTLPPMMRQQARLWLGQLYLRRTLGGLGDIGGAMIGLVGRPGSDRAGNARAAAGCFRQVLAEPEMSGEITAAAESLLGIAESLLALGEGRLRGLGGIRKAAAGLRRLHEQSQVATRGPILFQGSRLAAMDPLDRPVMLVGSTEPDTAAPRRPAARPAAAPADPRAAVRQRLSAGDDPFPVLAPMLDRDAPRPDVGLADDLTALATTALHSGTAGPDDHLLLAAALWLRARADEGTAADEDTEAALDSLSAAAAGIAGLPVPAVPVLFRMLVLLGDRDPAGHLPRALAPIVSALRAVGADALAVPEAGGVLLHAADGRAMTAGVRALPRRVLMIGDTPPTGALSMVSTVAGPAQVIMLAGRPRRRLDERPVILAGPAGDPALLRAFYPHATVLDAGGDRRSSAEASMLHVGDAAVTVPDRTGAGGGLVVLPPSARFPALADAFLAAGFSGAVGWLRPVPDRAAVAVTAALHAHLTLWGREPAAAVFAVRRWLRSPERAAVPHLPVTLAAALDAAGPRDLADSLVHRGV